MPIQQQGQGGGGGMFSRYSSEQINQIPEGYVQAMGQSPVANFIGSAVNAYMMGKKMKQEDASTQVAQTKANTESQKATTAERDSATNRGIQIAKYQTEVANAEYERTSKLHGEVKAQANKLEMELNSRLDEDKDKAPDDPSRLKPEEKAAMLGQIAKLRATQNTFLDRMIKHTESASIDNPAAPQNFTAPGPRYGNQNLTTGDGSFLRVPKGWTPTGSQPGFNEASSPQGQGAGGKGEKGPEGEAGPEGLEYPESPPPGTFYPKEELAKGQPTVNGETSPVGNNTPSQATAPNTIKGDFDYETIPSKSITSVGTNLPIPSTIGFKADGSTFVVHNQDSTNPEKNTPERLKDNLQVYRKANLLKYIIDNGLADSVVPTAQESKRALTDVITKDNAKQQYQIEKAYALLLRNTELGFSGQDFNADALTLKFKQDNQSLSPSDYLAAGTINFNDVTAQVSGGMPSKSTTAADITGALQQIGTSTKENVEALGKPDPNEKERFAVQKRLQQIGKDLLRYADDPQAIKTLTAEESNLKARALILGQQSQAFANEQAKNKTLLDAKLEVIKMVQKQAEQNSQQLVDTKNAQEINAKAGASAARYYGANSYEELTNLGGFVSAGLRKIPFMAVDSSGRRQPIRFRTIQGDNGEQVLDRMDIPEFVSWAAAYRPDLLARYEGFQPSQENINKAKEAHKMFSNIVEPMQQIVSTYGIKRGVFERKFDENTATAAVNRANLIGQFRVQLIGPGNPSNFEQDIVRDVIPESSDWFQKDSRSIAKLKAISMMAMMGHVTEMRANGFEPTEETIKQFNKGFKEVVGKELTMAEFLKLESDWTKVKSGYVSSGYKPSEKGNLPGTAGFDRSNNAFNKFQTLVDSLTQPKSAK